MNKLRSFRKLFPVVVLGLVMAMSGSAMALGNNAALLTDDVVAQTALNNNSAMITNNTLTPANLTAIDATPATLHGSANAFISAAGNQVANGLAFLTAASS
jgi:hypothetical protein